MMLLEKDKWITIMTVTMPSELMVLRSRLESEGIECLILNELTAQVNNFYSNAVGGVQLQVKESDYSYAAEIMKEAGYTINVEDHLSQWLPLIEKHTAKFPFLGKLPFFTRVTIMVILLVTIIVLTVYFITLPSKNKRLTSQTWVVENISYLGKDYRTQTNGYPIIKINGQDENELSREKIWFNKNGEITLPGFNTSMVSGKWRLDGNKLVVWNTEKFSQVYDGVYRVKFRNSNLELISDKTIISCIPDPTKTPILF